MIVEMDEIDIKDKLNNLRLVLKTKAKSKYGKGKRKQKVAVHTKTGKVVMATRTVGEGQDKKKPKPLSAKQHQMIKDAFKDEHVHTDPKTKKQFKQHVFLGLSDKLDKIHPNHGMNDEDITHHVKNHPDFHTFHGRDSMFVRMHIDKGKTAPSKPVKVKATQNKEGVNEITGLLIKKLVEHSNYPLSAQEISVRFSQTSNIQVTPKQIEKHLKNHPDFETHKEGNLLRFTNKKRKRIDAFRSPMLYPDPASVSGTLYPDNTTDDSDFIDFIESHPDNKDDNKDFHPGLKDPKWARKAEFVRILQGIIYPQSGFGYGKDWEKEKNKPHISNLTMKQVESALRLANMTNRNIINRTAYYHFGGVANGKKLSKKREEAPITLKDVESIYEPCLKFDYEESSRLWERNWEPNKPAKDQKKGRGTRKPKKSDYGKGKKPPIDPELLRTQIFPKPNPNPNPNPNPTPSKPVKVKKVKNDGSQVSGRGTRKPVDPIREHAMDRQMMDKFFNEKEAKIKPDQDTKGWTDALEAFEKQGKSIPRNQFHALKNKFGVKDHKMHAPEWVHDKESDSYVHKPKWESVRGLTKFGVKKRERKLKL